MIAERLGRALSAARLEALLDETCAAVPDGPRREALRAYAQRRRAGIEALAGALRAPEDEPELVGLLAAAWLELRCEWERHNNVANYQLCSSGEDAEPEVMACAATASGLLAWLEEVIPPNVVEGLGSTMLDLLERIRVDARARAAHVDA